MDRMMDQTRKAIRPSPFEKGGAGGGFFWTMERLILLGTLSAALLSLLLVQRLRVQEPGPPERRVVPVALENVSGISWDGEALWVTVDGTGVIHRVDPDSGAIDRRIELGVA